MSAAIYTVRKGAPGYGYFVERRDEHSTALVAGPFTTRAEAARAADERNGIAPSPSLVHAALDSQTAVNRAVVRALEALSLQADKYDDAIDGLRVATGDLLDRVSELERRIDNLPGSGSVRV